MNEVLIETPSLAKYTSPSINPSSELHDPPGNVINIKLNKVDKPVCDPTEVLSVDTQSSKRKDKIVNNKRKESDKIETFNSTKNKTTSVNIVKSQYYKHFIEEVNNVKDIICDDVQHYRFEANDTHVQNLLNLIQRIQELIKILPQNLVKKVI